jgi:hypothetical protein
MRRSSDKVDWDALTAQSLQIVETALQPRKQEWLVLSGKPVAGSKEAVHDGTWFAGNADLGWAALPDTEDMPRMVDGAMLEWANINTKLPNQEGYLEARPTPVFLATESAGQPRTRLAGSNPRRGMHVPCRLVARHPLLLTPVPRQIPGGRGAPCPARHERHQVG